MKKRAFTLIELLVVIAIIAILAAILFPVFAQAKTAAKGAQSINNLKQLATASLLYANDYDDAYVSQWISVENSYGWQASWIMLTLPYTKNYAIFKDPMDTTKLTTAFDSGPKFSYVGNGILSGDCGSSWGGWKFRGVINSNGDPSFGSTNWYENGIRTQTGIPQVAATILFATRQATPKGSAHAADAGLMEGAFGSFNSILQMASSNDYDQTAGYNKNGTLPGQADYFSAPDVNYKGYIDRVYNGRSNFAYTDGHAKNKNPNQTVDFGGGTADGNAGGCFTKRFLSEWDALRN